MIKLKISIKKYLNLKTSKQIRDMGKNEDIK